MTAGLPKAKKTAPSGENRKAFFLAGGKGGGKMRDRKSSGFTLVEIMIFVAVLGIIAGIAAPNFLYLGPQSRLNGAARQMATDLAAARMKAVSTNSNAWVKILDAHQYQIWVDLNKNGIVDSGEPLTLKSIRSNYPDVSFSPSGDFTFNSRGGAALFFALSLSNSGGAKSIDTNSSGRIKIL
jgi:type IV fimbrial biogenesis protein FimT